MFSLCQNFYKWVAKRQQKEITLLVLGVNNAGKSTLIASLKKESPELISPTIGFSSENVKFGGRNLCMFDLGGGPRFRRVWNHYFAEAFGIIYMIDGTDEEQLKVSKGVLIETLKNQKLADKPILIILNKHDQENKFLKTSENQLEMLSIKNKYLIISGTSLTAVGQQIEESVNNGIQWLISQIDSEYISLKKKIEQDVWEQQEKERIENEQRKKQIEAMRKQRENQQQMETRPTTVN